MPNERPEQLTKSATPVRFQIIHLLYAMALIASALATFGVGGIMLSAILCGTWGWVFMNESRPRAFKAATLFFIFSGCFIGLILSAITAGVSRANRMVCSNNLKQIALALHNYHDVYKSFPPAYITDEQGLPMHSWRVLILPFIDEQALYEKYNFDEPWDGPNNRRLLSHIPPTYQCPNCQASYLGERTSTSYQAVVSDKTIWPNDRSCQISDAIDGAAFTALVLEVSDVTTHWMAPNDVTYSKAVDLLVAQAADFDTGHITRSFFYETAHGRNCAFVDGRVRFLGGSIDREAAERFFRISDQQSLDTARLDGVPHIEVKRLRIYNCIRLAVFIVICFWPLPWVWINPHGTNRKALQAAPDEELRDANDQRSS